MPDPTRTAASAPSLPPLSPGAGLLLAGLTLLLLAIWLLPESSALKQSAVWFPTWVHSTTELVAVVVAILVFSVTWHSYRAEQAGNLTVLACGYLAVGLLDSAHLLSYRGMPDFITPASPEKAIDFWLAARLIAALSLLIVSLRHWQPLRQASSRPLLLGGALALVGLIVYLRLWHPQVFPRTFIEGQGLTAVKIATEWLIIGLLICAALALSLRHHRRPFDVQTLLLAVGISILSELCFTAYRNVHDIYSLIGHLYKVLAYLLIYRVVFVSSVEEPYRRLAAEISERHAAEAKAETLAFYDTLTGLPNLELLRDRTEQALAASQRNGKAVAMLIMDVDGFKTINDSLGHSYGDELLRSIAARLHALLRSNDTLCRQSGDEFAILLPEQDSSEPAGYLAEKIMRNFKEPFSLFGHTLSVSVSLGVAVAPNDGKDFEALLRNAETAMYQAKQQGRQTWCYFDQAMNREALEVLTLVNDLRQAVEREQMRLYYQPQVDLRSGRLLGVEALVRWQHAERGLVSPAQFIPLAEETRLIVPIGHWILQEACRQAMLWKRAGLDIPQVAVNISAVQLQHGNLEQSVLQALASSQLPAAMLELEITESSLIDKTDQVLDTLKRLKALGVRLSIDDFGTGYSSLAYLRTLAVDKLKIDQSFVRDLPNSADSRAIVTAIVHMAQSLGLTTIAEGVEEQAIARTLSELDCHEAQGYLYARPLPADQLGELVAGWRAEDWAIV